MTAPPDVPLALQEQLRASQERATALSRLLGVAKTINSSLDKHEVIARIIRASSEVMQADSASLLLLDPVTRELVFEVVLGEAGKALKRPGVRLPPGEGVAGWVAETGQPLVLADAYEDDRFSPKYDRLTGYRTRSILCVPLKIEDEVIGVAQVINKMGPAGPRVFDEVDLETFTTFCGLAAIAVDRARLHEELLEKQRYDQEIELAHAIQQSFLATDFPCPDKVRFAARTIPARKVGGDFYDIFELDGRIGVTIGDVSGKGMFAALYMARFLSEFRYLAALARDPADAVAQANDLLAARSTRGMFITLVYIALDPDSGRAQLVNAGHHAPVGFDRTRARVGPVPAPGGPPLGVMEGLTYEQHTFELAPGDGLLLYTDGASEARNGDGQEYGLTRLEACLARATEGPMQAVLDDIGHFTGGAPQHDDLTLATIEARAR